MAVFAAIPYTYAIFYGHRPSYATWIVWFVVGATAFVFHFQTGAHNSLWLPLIYVVVPLWYLSILWFLERRFEMDRLEKLCLAGAAVSWLVWVAAHVFGGPAISSIVPLLVIVVVDSFGSIPTIRHAWNGHENDNSVSWTTTGIATTAGLASVENWQSAEVIYPGYLAIAMGLIAIFANIRKSEKGSLRQ